MELIETQGTWQGIGKFEKVSYGQFYDAIVRDAVENGVDSQTFAKLPIRETYDRLELPSRATTGSAGYDFKSPFTFVLEPGQSAKIPTGIRVKMEPGWWLGCFPRSGLGFRYRLQLDNTVGVIDGDYYGSDNEGHIFAKITNDCRDGRVLTINVGDSFMQGIFIPFGTTYSDDVAGVRNGGMGSTDSGNRGGRNNQT